jgi:hypothetical protein
MRVLGRDPYSKNSPLAFGDEGHLASIRAVWKPQSRRNLLPCHNAYGQRPLPLNPPPTLRQKEPKQGRVVGGDRTTQPPHLIPSSALIYAHSYTVQYSTQRANSPQRRNFVPRLGSQSMFISFPSQNPVLCHATQPQYNTRQLA